MGISRDDYIGLSLREETLDPSRQREVGWPLRYRHVVGEAHPEPLEFEQPGVAHPRILGLHGPAASAVFTRSTPLRTLATTHSHGRELVMAIAHRELPQLGVQFHPESVLTPHGQQLLRAVITWAEQQEQGSEQVEEVVR